RTAGSPSSRCASTRRRASTTTRRTTDPSSCRPTCCRTSTRRPADVPIAAPRRYTRAVRERDLETLELPRVLDAVPALARSPPGRDAVRALRPTADAGDADRRLQVTDELVARLRDGERLPTAD